MNEMRKLMEAVNQLDEAYQRTKTEHAGAKKGKGAYYGKKKEAKRDSNKKRRKNDQAASLGEDGKNPRFNKDGYRTLFRDLPVTGIEGETFKVTAVDYDASVSSNMAEIDGVMVGWYDPVRGEGVYIHIRDLENILNKVKRNL